MIRAQNSLLLALLLALAVHLAILATAQQYARRDLGWWLRVIRPAPAALNLPAPPPPEEDLGDHHTEGKSINSAPGDHPLESVVADAQQEQALLSRDPTGFANGGKQSADAAMQTDPSEAQQQQQQNLFASQESPLDTSPGSTPKPSNQPPQKEQQPQQQ